MSDKQSEITIQAYAKINLSIDVLGKRPDGYHEVLMVMQQVELFDMVRVSWQPDSGGAEDRQIRIALTTNLPYLPADNRNIAYKAAESMAGHYGEGRSGSLVIDIEKRIPVAAGLAGGSADCAAVLHAVNMLWETELDLAALMKLGTKLGADVSFCLAGQAALNEVLGLAGDPMAGTCAVASGIGEKLEKAVPLKSWVLLSKPSISLSTAQVYGGLRLQEITERPDTAELTAGLREGNLYKISKNMVNVLENYSLKEYPSIMYTKNKMVQEGNAYKALMSGSGPTVFGLFTSKRKGTAAFIRLKALNMETFLVKTL
jgi:4-diphosphocytidyl-2-C-methyl-D-erythritol kinase